MMNSSQSQLAISSAGAAEELLKRRAARSGLHAFITYLYPEYITSQFSQQVCAALDEFLIEMAQGLRPVLLLGAPPQHGKSDMVSRYFPAYAFGRYPELRVAGLSYAKDLAMDMNRDVQRIMLSGEYKTLFPHSALNAKRVVTVELEAKRNSDMFEIVNHRGSYLGQGVGGPLTGKKVDLGIIDDPIKNASEADSSTVKNSLWNWYVSTFLTRLSKNSGQIIMATRWAVDDLSGRIEESNPRVKVLYFKAIDEDGNALVPELHPIDKLLETKATMTERYWSAMYQQDPFVQGGGLFPVDRFGVIEHAPARGLIKSSCRFWDKAGTSGAGDWTVGTLMHAMEDGSFVIEDVQRGQWAALERERVIRKTAELDGPSVPIGVEQEPGSGGKESAEATIRNLAGFNVTAERATGSKELRADGYAAQVQGNNVYLVRGPWNRQFLDEHEAFPNGPNDDTIDSASGAFNAQVRKKPRAGVW